MTQDRKKLSTAENNFLWATTGGKCALCKKDLILDDVTKLVNIGEKAHVIGHGDKGPRREFIEEHGLNEDSLDALNNIILVCLECHTLIDRNESKYSPEFLYQAKADHENWIKARINPEDRSVVLIHKTKGPKLDHVALANQLNTILVQSVHHQEEFTDLTVDGWERAKSKNQKIFEELCEVKDNFKGCSISIFPLSHIPLLIHLGVLLTDTIPVTVYQYDRIKEHWVSGIEKSGVEKVIDLGIEVNEQMGKSTDLVVTMSVSAPINSEDVLQVMGCNDWDSIDISIVEPEINKVLYREHVEQLKNVFKRSVEKANQVGRYQKVHLFYAGPAGLAIELGRCINPTMWPEVNLYHYESRQVPRYQYAFSV